MGTDLTVLSFISFSLRFLSADEVSTVGGALYVGSFSEEPVDNSS